MIVGLYLEDFSLLNKITNKLKGKEFTLRHVKDVSKISRDISIIISESKIGKCEIPQIRPENLEILELRIRCEFYSCRNLIAGIDPGGTTGLAIVCGNRVLFQSVFDKIDVLFRIIESIHSEIGINSIKIGTGSPPERNRIINSLRKHSAILQLVNEKSSGSGSHTAAATRIALRKEMSETPLVYKPKNGEIAWIQQESRRLSKGLVTIDKQLAHQILIGKTSMKDAIKTYTKRIRTTNSN